VRSAEPYDVVCQVLVEFLSIPLETVVFELVGDGGGLVEGFRTGGMNGEVHEQWIVEQLVALGDQVRGHAALGHSNLVSFLSNRNKKNKGQFERF
jgi:hypothetical protein